MIKTSILKASEKNRTIIRLHYQNEDDENYDGIVIKATNRVVVLTCQSDFEFDGYQVLLRERITGYRNSKYENCYTKILSHNKHLNKVRPPMWSYSIEDICSAIKVLNKNKVWPAIETVRNSKGAFYIGPITSVGEDNFKLYCYDATGKWEKEYKLGFDEVIRIEWASKYCTHFNNYMKVHNPSLKPIAATRLRLSFSLYNISKKESKMFSEKAPNFKDKTVLFHLTNSEYDTTIHNPIFELQNGRLFVTGIVAEGSTQNDWLSGRTVSVAWDHVQGYIVFESANDYLARLSLAWKEGKLQ